MAGKNTAAFGIYPNRASVDRAVDTLKAENFRNTDISVLFPENEGSKEFAHEKNTKAPEGAATGAGAACALPDRAARSIARQGSARWLSLVSGPSLLPAPSWPHWREQESEEQWAV